jgi:hypothetical protein
MSTLTADDDQGAPPPKSSLGAWLLRKAQALQSAIDGLKRNAAANHAEIIKLQRLVEQLRGEAERSAKVQVIQTVELEQVRQLVKQTQQQLSGVRISRGTHKARAEKLLQDLEDQLN